MQKSEQQAKPVFRLNREVPKDFLKLIQRAAIRQRLKAAAAGSARFLKKDTIDGNCVFVRAFALCTVLGATTTLKNGILLAVAAAAVCLPLYLVMAPFYRKLPLWLRYPLVFAAAGALMIPVTILSTHFAPEVTASVGIFLPITAVNAAALFTARSMGTGIKGEFRALAYSLSDILGFAAVMIVIAAFRETIGDGTLYARSLPFFRRMKFQFVLMPPGAFLLLGLLLAAASGIAANRKRKHGEEKL